MDKIKIALFTIIVGVSLAATATFAAVSWQGTSWIVDGGVISAESIKSNFSYLYSRIGGSAIPVCMGSKKALQWDGGRWHCVTIGVAAAQASTILIGSSHNDADCTAIGGNTYNTSSGYICAVAGSSCPAGWTQHQRWSTTAARTCNAGGTTSTATGWACASTCTTSLHGFSSKSTETCVYNTGTATTFSCLSQQSHTCSAIVIQVGCK